MDGGVGNALGTFGKIQAWITSIVSMIIGIICIFIGWHVYQTKSCKTTGVIASASSPPTANTYMVNINSNLYSFNFATSMKIGSTVTLYNCNPSTTSTNAAMTMPSNTVGIILLVIGLILPLSLIHI